MLPEGAAAGRGRGRQPSAPSAAPLPPNAPRRCLEGPRQGRGRPVPAEPVLLPRRERSRPGGGLSTGRQGAAGPSGVTTFAAPREAAGPPEALAIPLGVTPPSSRRAIQTPAPPQSGGGAALRFSPPAAAAGGLGDRSWAVNGRSWSRERARTVPPACAPGGEDDSTAPARTCD